MLGVSVETLRRWEAEGRLTMARSEGGQRLVDIDQVASLLAERRKAATDRPIVAQSARNRFAGIITRIEADRVAAVVEVHGRSPSPGQPDDRRGGRGAGPPGRGRGGLRRQGNQRDRRDPVGAGSRAREQRVVSRARRQRSPPSSPPSSSPRVRAAAAARRPLRGCPVRGRIPRRAIPIGRRRQCTHRLRRGVAQGRPGQGQDRLRGGQPGHHADDLDRLVVGARDPDRAGRSRGRVPVGRHDQPHQARHGGTRDGHAGRIRRQQADRDRARRQPRRVSRRPRTWPSRASRSSPPATRCRSPSTRRSSWPISPRSRATRPALPRPTPRTSPPRRRTSSRSWPRSSSARATRDRLRHRCGGVRQGQGSRRSRQRQRPGDLFGRGRQGVAEPGCRGSKFLSWFAGPDGQAILSSFGFLPPPAS